MAQDPGPRQPPWVPFPETEPTVLYRPRDAARVLDLLAAAIWHLDLFGVLAREPLPREDLRERLGIEARPARVLVTLLLSMGLIEREAAERDDGPRLRLSPVARDFLDPQSPFSLRPYYRTAALGSGCAAMLEVLRSGRPLTWVGEDDAWAKAMEDGEFAAAFTAEMDCRGVYLGPLVAQKLGLERHSQLLDIGGGSGIYSCAAVAASPHLRAAVLEKPPVDAIARRSIASRGFAERVNVLSGDMFAPPLPRGFDLHLYSNVLHDWDEERVRQLIRASFDAIEPGGTLAVHDAHLDADDAGPLHVAEYSVLLMSVTEGRCYSVREMEEFLVDAGFREIRCQDVAVHRSLITASKPGGAG
jgi:SAM-dependent methyltransferase